MNLLGAFSDFHSGKRKSKIIRDEEKDNLGSRVCELYLNGLTLKEVAEELDIPKGKVRNVLRANDISLVLRKKEQNV